MSIHDGWIKGEALTKEQRNASVTRRAKGVESCMMEGEAWRVEKCVEPCRCVSRNRHSHHLAQSPVTVVSVECRLSPDCLTLYSGFMFCGIDFQPNFLRTFLLPAEAVQVYTLNDHKKSPKGASLLK